MSDKKIFYIEGKPKIERFVFHNQKTGIYHIVRYMGDLNQYVLAGFIGSAKREDDGYGIGFMFGSLNCYAETHFSLIDVNDVNEMYLPPDAPTDVRSSHLFSKGNEMYALVWEPLQRKWYLDVNPHPTLGKVPNLPVSEPELSTEVDITEYRYLKLTISKSVPNVVTDTFPLETSKDQLTKEGASDAMASIPTSPVTRQLDKKPEEKTFRALEAKIAGYEGEKEALLHMLKEAKDALECCRGILDTPIARRKYPKTDWLYWQTLPLLRASLGNISKIIPDDESDPVTAELLGLTDAK